MAETEGQIIPRGTTPEGEDKWLVRVYQGRDAQGRKKYVSKTAYGSKKEAEKVLRKLLGKKDRRQLKPRSDQTLKALIREWLDEVATIRVKPQTVQNYRHNLDAYIVEPLGSYKLHQLERKHFRRLVVNMTKRDLAPRTIRYAVHLASQVLNFALDEGRIDFNPAERIDLPKQLKTERRAHTTEELAKLKAACLADVLGALWLLMLCTGLRPGEALGLKWTDVKLKGDHPSVHVRRATTRLKGKKTQETTTKTEKQRTVSLPVELVPILTAHKATQGKHRLEMGINWVANGYLFPNEIGELRDWGAVRRRHWDKVKVAAGLPEMRAYDLRHEFVSQLLDAGVSLPATAAAAGHADPSVTARVYAHAIPGKEDEAAAAISGAVFGVSPDTPDSKG